MTGLQQQQTTKCGLDESGRFLSGSRHPDWKDLLEPELENARFGSWTIVSRNIQRRGKHIYANVRCDCGKEDWKVLDNLRRGLSTACRPCSTTARHHKAGNMIISSEAERTLQGRITAIIQRCTNPNDKNWKNYGGRGIEFRFSSTKECADYLTSLHPAEDWRGLEIDRIDNNRHYEAGNLRRATQAQNRQNRRKTRWVSYNGQMVVKNHLWHLIKTDFPAFDFGPGKVRTLVEQGMDPNDIPQYTRVGYRMSTTSKTPDPAIVSLYRGN
jgi:hypothetical protein